MVRTAGVILFHDSASATARLIGDFYASETTNLETRSLFYEPVKSTEGKPSSIPSIVKAIQDASGEVDGVLPETAASDFAKLIQVLRQSRKKDILTAWMQVKSGAGVQNKDRALYVAIFQLYVCSPEPYLWWVVEKERGYAIAEIFDVLFSTSSLFYRT